MTHWAREAVFYHLYPLGCLGAPPRNDPAAPIVPRLPRLHAWLDHLQALGANALYLGPVFESETHGYDTLDYSQVDRRLGSREDLAALVASAHARGLRVVLDAVFHHVGRGFPAFRDVLEHGRNSRFADWFHLHFDAESPCGDPFAYEGWNGHYNLVKLNVANPEVRDHLFQAVSGWLADFSIDGLRLDAADRLDRAFQRALAAHCRALRPDFWLLGEVIHGDYRLWTEEAGLDCVTNYELYKGLWSSHNDANYFEAAYTLNRQSGPDGRYRDLALYTFADNHDVDRVASRLLEPAHLYPLHILLFAGPGIPSIYYGSEYGLEGAKLDGDDSPLRPVLTPATLAQSGPHPDLTRVVASLAAFRRDHPSLRRGTLENLHVAHRQYTFARQAPDELAVVAVNASDKAARPTLSSPLLGNRRFVDVLNNRRPLSAAAGRLLLNVHPHWGCILISRD
jgi:glycosidase